ncbi:hypothetical protein YSA_04799 [Pseudomonas putida ND6]|uniref:Uncharacterized protein n=1 Tax=Pseudomonas putida ND6 TaxID=231023 RepID=I3UV45_PSEPU|nr:hypothetical protein YSA_04799 [Pseudomonas putida ND6]
MAPKFRRHKNLLPDTIRIINATKVGCVLSDYGKLRWNLFVIT